jgi:hypothetical protein
MKTKFLLSVLISADSEQQANQIADDIEDMIHGVLGVTDVQPVD